jgi:putative nucleotidyltransferase with HDIG domain
MEPSVHNNEFEFIQGLTLDLSAPVLIFPTSLSATMSIRRAIIQDNISNDTLARIIGAEPVLSAQILKLSNSAAFNPSGKINTELRTATMRLGYIKVRNLTIAVGMKQLTEHKDLNKEISELMEGLWNRSVRVAAFSAVLAKKYTKVNAENAMLAGLLHDVGKFYILNRANHYRSLFTSQRALWNLVDAWHSNIGAAILENWEVSEDIRNAVQNFGNLAYVHRGACDLTDVIFAADLLDAHFDERSHRKLNWEGLPAVVARLELDEEKSEQLHELMKVELDAFLSAIA